MSEFESLLVKTAQARTLHMRYGLPRSHADYLKRQSVAAMYAAWEFFLRRCFSIYLAEINRKQLDPDDINYSYLAYHIEKTTGISQPRHDFKSIQELAQKIHEIFKGPIFLAEDVSVRSNANFKVVNALLKKFDLQCLDVSYSRQLDKLLRYRNCVAHGDNSIPVSQSDLDDFGRLLHELAENIILYILHGFSNGVYVK